MMTRRVKRTGARISVIQIKPNGSHYPQDEGDERPA